MRLWFIRHALVAPEALAFLYGTNDVPICESSMEAHGTRYAALAARLPRPAQVVITPLSRTRLTFEALVRAGYPEPERALHIEKAFIEQDFGHWQGRAIAEFTSRVREGQTPILADPRRRNPAGRRELPGHDFPRRRRHGKAVILVPRG